MEPQGHGGFGLEGLRNLVRREVCATDFVAAEDGPPVHTRFEGIRLGAVDVFRYEGQGVRGGSRSPDQVRSNPVDDFLVLIPVNAQVRVEQSARSSYIEPGEFAFLSTRAPYEVDCSQVPRLRYSELFIRLDGSVVRGAMPTLDRCCAWPMSTAGPGGLLLTDLLQGILSHAGRVIGEQRAAMASMVIGGVVAATLESAQVRDLLGDLRMDPQTRLRQKALAFVERNLPNAALDATMVARACGVSLRSLHSSFAATDRSIGGLIRDLRMTRCRTDLTSPSLKGRSILEISTQWGYGVSSSFTRAYREHFGCTPTEDRQRMLGADVGAS